jgi:medium-chain acyl-[acyl-carrier-protein] hydrolase
MPPPAPTESELAEELQRLGATPPELLETPSLLRALSADATLYRNYVYAEDAPLPCPIRAYGGADDPNIRPEHLEAWGRQTTGSFRMRVFPGGHFYFWDNPGELREALKQDLREA